MPSESSKYMLLVAQRHQWVHFGGTAGGHVTSEGCDSDENRGDGSHRHRTARADIVEQAGHQPRESQRSTDAEHKSSQSQDQTTAEDKPQQAGFGSAESGAYSEFLCPLGNGVRNDAVNADRGQHERE